MSSSRRLLIALAVIIAPVAAALMAAALVGALLPAPAETAPARKPSPPPLPHARAVDPNTYVIKSALKIDRPLDFGDWVWDEKAAPKSGPMLITVDLAAQTLSVFRDGHEIGVSVIHYGGEGKPTPLGRFPILAKFRVHSSTIYDDAAMPYTLRLRNDGVSIHGDEVINGQWGSNGCVGVPIPFAARLFDAVRIGDPVLITSGRRLAVGDDIPATEAAAVR